MMIGNEPGGTMPNPQTDKPDDDLGYDETPTEITSEIISDWATLARDLGYDF